MYGPMARTCRRSGSGIGRIEDASMKILVLNAGSSSLKFNLFEGAPADIEANAERVLAKGETERVSSMADALKSVFQQIDPRSVEAVGHRVVHGGDQFHQSVIIDA